MSKPTIRTLATPFGLAVLGILSLAPAASADDWKWSITPYAWATDIAADLSIDDRRVAERRIDFADLVDDLDFTSQVRAVGRRGRHGLLLDVFHVQLAGEDKRFALPALPGGGALADADLKLTLLDAGGTFNPRGDGQGFALLYGGRLMDRDVRVDARFDLGPAGTLSQRYAVNETLYDALLGIGYTGRITPRLTYELRADASTGGTEHTASAWAGLDYAFGDSGRYALLAGYRYMDIEFKKDAAPGEVDVQATLSGFVSGLRISF